MIVIKNAVTNGIAKMSSSIVLGGGSDEGRACSQLPKSPRTRQPIVPDQVAERALLQPAAQLGPKHPSQSNRSRPENSWPSASGQKQWEKAKRKGRCQYHACCKGQPHNCGYLFHGGVPFLLC